MADISVIIPTRNAGPDFAALLDLIRTQQQRPREIIVIDSESSDGTTEIARRCGCTVVPVAAASFDHGSTRNRALQFAQGSIVVYTVQDAIPANSRWLDRLVAPLEKSDIAAASSRQLARPQAGVAERVAREVVYPETALVRYLGDLQAVGMRGLLFSDAAAAYRKEALVGVGGFREGIIVAEDIDVAFRLMSAGYGIAYVPDSTIVHSHDYGLKEQFQRNFDMGVFFAISPEIARYARGQSGMKGMALDLTRRSFAAAPLWSWPALAGDLFARAAGMSLGRFYPLFGSRLSRRLSRSKSFWGRL